MFECFFPSLLPPSVSVVCKSLPYFLLYLNLVLPFFLCMIILPVKASWVQARVSNPQSQVFERKSLTVAVWELHLSQFGI